MHTSLTFMEPATAARVIRTLDTHTPILWEDFANLSSAFFVVGETSLALTNARRALSLHRSQETLLNLAVILESQGKFHSALPLSAEAYWLDTGNRTVACHYTDALLRMGRFEDTEMENYSWSHADWDKMKTCLPEWRGENPAGKRILVLPGGGYGDEILFLRWLPRLADLGATITYMCMPDFEPLIRDLSYIHYTIPGSVSGFTGEIRLSHYDYFMCIRDLLRHFCLTPSAIPTRPYLFADPVQTTLRREVLRLSRWPLIGICTRAGEESFPRRHRSLTDSQTAKVLSAQRNSTLYFEWVNLNKESLLPGMVQPVMRTWADTAAVISTLDIVVTVDTGVAHLAGAMGVPAFVILPGISAAYYGIDGDHCSFYPTHRLFRNRAEGIDESVSAVCAAIKELQ